MKKVFLFGLCFFNFSFFTLSIGANEYQEGVEESLITFHLNYLEQKSNHNDLRFNVADSVNFAVRAVNARRRLHKSDADFLKNIKTIYEFIGVAIQMSSSSFYNDFHDHIEQSLVWIKKIESDVLSEDSDTPSTLSH